MSLIHNERVKLTAGAIDRASTACLSIGVLGPAVALLYNFGAMSSPVSGIVVGMVGTFWLIASVGLHAFAHAILKGLK